MTSLQTSLGVIRNAKNQLFFVNPSVQEVVLAEKPLISEETDLIEPTLLDELICYIGSLASVYHKPPSAFVEGRNATRRVLPTRTPG